MDWYYFIRHDDLQLQPDGNVWFEIQVHVQLIFIFMPARLEDGAIGNDPHACRRRFIGLHFGNPQISACRRARIAPYDLQHADPPTPSGLATGLPHYSGQVRPAVLCVTASISGICKAGTLDSSFYAYWTRHSIRKYAPDCHIFVKGLSVPLDKQRLLRKQIKIFQHRGHRGAQGTAGSSLLQADTRILAALGMKTSF